MIEFSREQIIEEFKDRQQLHNESESESYPCFYYSRFIEGSHEPITFNRFNINDNVISDFIRTLTSLKDNQIMTFTSSNDDEKLTISSTSVNDAYRTYIISNTANCTITAVTIDAASNSSILEFRNVATGQSIWLEDLYSIIYMMNLCNEARKRTRRFVNEWS